MQSCEDSAVTCNYLCVVLSTLIYRWFLSEVLLLWSLLAGWFEFHPLGDVTTEPRPGPARPRTGPNMPPSVLCSAPHTSPLGTAECHSYGQQEIREGSGGLPAVYLDMCSLGIDREEGGGGAGEKVGR